MKLLHIPTNTIINVSYTAYETCLDSSDKCLASNINHIVSCSNCQCNRHNYNKHKEEYIKIEE